MVVHLLTLGRLRAKQRATAVDQVGTLFVHFIADYKVFLLRADGRAHVGHVGVAEQLKYAHRLTVNGLHRAQERGLLIQRVSAVGTERGGYAQSIILNKCVRRGIPRGIAARLERAAQTARREAGRIRLALYKLLAGKLHYYMAVRGGGYEAVVLFSGNAGHGLEPVGVVSGALLNRPILHRVGDYIGNSRIQALTVLHRLAQCLVRILWQSLAHQRIVEYEGSKQFGNLTHRITPLQ